MCFNRLLPLAAEIPFPAFPGQNPFPNLPPQDFPFRRHNQRGSLPEPDPQPEILHNFLYPRGAFQPIQAVFQPFLPFNLSFAIHPRFKSGLPFRLYGSFGLRFRTHDDQRSH